MAVRAFTVLPDLTRRRAGACLLACAAPSRAASAPTALTYFPVSPLHAYRWQMLALALAHAPDGPAPALHPFADADTSQKRAVRLLESGRIDVACFGPDAQREAQLQPVRIDILRGMLGFRLLLIRAADQARIAALDADGVRRELVYGFNSQWADLAILRANGLRLVTATGYENLFAMLAAGRFDAFPRGLNEAHRELAQFRGRFPGLAVEATKALYFPFPVWFWVRRENAALAERIEQGLRAALADGSFRRLFEAYHADEIALMKRGGRQVIMLAGNGGAETNTSWWWPDRPR